MGEHSRAGTEREPLLWATRVRRAQLSEASDTSWSGGTSAVRNLGSHARDYCGEYTDMSSVDFTMHCSLTDRLVRSAWTSLESIAFERTFLSHIRFGLVLFALTVSLLCRARFNQPVNPFPDPILAGSLYTWNCSVPLGTAYAGATLLMFVAGFIWYERSYREFETGKAFVEGESR